jgi:hypothetical protein
VRTTKIYPRDLAVGFQSDHRSPAPQVLSTICISSGETPFAVGAGLLTFLGMVYLKMSALASPMFVLSVIFGASIRCQEELFGEWSSVVAGCC